MQVRYTSEIDEVSLMYLKRTNLPLIKMESYTLTTRTFTLGNILNRFRTVKNTRLKIRRNVISPNDDTFWRDKKLNDMECAICSKKYTNGDEICILECKHIYHINCICEWVRRSRTCPMCRSNISLV